LRQGITPRQAERLFQFGYLIAEILVGGNTLVVGEQVPFISLGADQALPEVLFGPQHQIIGKACTLGYKIAVFQQVLSQHQQSQILQDDGCGKCLIGPLRGLKGKLLLLKLLGLVTCVDQALPYPQRLRNRKRNRRSLSPSRSGKPLVGRALLHIQVHQSSGWKVLGEC